jgi:hypothetical protein
MRTSLGRLMLVWQHHIYRVGRDELAGHDRFV